MYEEGKGGGAKRQRIDLLAFFSLYMSRRCLLQQMLHLINANTIVAMRTRNLHV